MKKIIFSTLLLSVFALYGMDEITQEPMHPEISMNRPTSVPTSTQKTPRRRTKRDRKTQKNSIQPTVDKFGAEEIISASDSPWGTTYGESN